MPWPCRSTWSRATRPRAGGCSAITSPLTGAMGDANRATRFQAPAATRMGVGVIAAIGRQHAHGPPAPLYSILHPRLVGQDRGPPAFSTATVRASTRARLSTWASRGDHRPPTGDAQRRDSAPTASRASIDQRGRPSVTWPAIASSSAPSRRQQQRPVRRRPGTRPGRWPPRRLGGEALGRQGAGPSRQGRSCSAASSSSAVMASMPAAAQLAPVPGWNRSRMVTAQPCCEQAPGDAQSGHSGADDDNLSRRPLPSRNFRKSGQYG